MITVHLDSGDVPGNPMIEPSLPSADVARPVETRRATRAPGYARLGARNVTERAAEACVDVLVAGSALYGADDPSKAIAALRTQAAAAVRG